MVYTLDKKNEQSQSRAAASRLMRQNRTGQNIEFIDNRDVNPAIQRIVQGEDPISKGNILEPAHTNDLLYGIASYRHDTIKRINRAKEKRSKGLIQLITSLLSMKKEPEGETASKPKRTIDEYNNAVGIDSSVLGPMRAGIGIYKIRKALEYPNEWKSHLRSSDYNYPTDATEITNEQKWMTFLVEDKDNIGLQDLGSKNRPTTRGRFGRVKRGEAEGLTRIKSKRRFEKNIQSVYEGKFSPNDVHLMLGFGLDEDAAYDYFRQISNAKKEGVADWVQKAFFRRTSKLGIHFATSESGLNARVHFNLTSSEKQDDGTRLPKLWGVIEDAAKEGGHRKITNSEYRYIFRMLKENPRLMDKIKFYSEYEE